MKSSRAHDLIDSWLTIDQISYEISLELYRWLSDSFLIEKVFKLIWNQPEVLQVIIWFILTWKCIQIDMNPGWSSTAHDSMDSWTLQKPYKTIVLIDLLNGNAFKTNKQLTLLRCLMKILLKPSKHLTLLTFHGFGHYGAGTQSPVIFKIMKSQ